MKSGHIRTIHPTIIVAVSFEFFEVSPHCLLGTLQISGTLFKVSPSIDVG